MKKKCKLLLTFSQQCGIILLLTESQQKGMKND